MSEPILCIFWEALSATFLWKIFSVPDRNRWKCISTLLRRVNSTRKPSNVLSRVCIFGSLAFVEWVLWGFFPPWKKLKCTHFNTRIHCLSTLEMWANWCSYVVHIKEVLGGLNGVSGISGLSLSQEPTQTKIWMWNLSSFKNKRFLRTSSTSLTFMWNVVWRLFFCVFFFFWGCTDLV